MSIKIETKIVGYEVVREEEEATALAEAQADKEERKSAKVIPHDRANCPAGRYGSFGGGNL